MPVEIMAQRGPQTLTFGPMKPVGLMTPAGGKPYAVVQLRQDDAAKQMYNLVGFQTHLKFPEQKRVFQMIPGLENCRFAKYGRMHKNTYINAPKILNPTFQTKEYPNIFMTELIVIFALGILIGFLSTFLGNLGSPDYDLYSILGFIVIIILTIVNYKILFSEEKILYKILAFLSMILPAVIIALLFFITSTISSLLAAKIKSI